MGQFVSTECCATETSELSSLSVVIPTLNEAPHLANSIQSVLKVRATKLPEVLVVDGGSTDGTKKVALGAGAKVVLSSKGRGLQLNAGWRAARGKWVLFLHGDSQLPDDYLHLMDDAVRQASECPSRSGNKQPPVWGCFSTIKTDLQPPLAWLLSLGVHLRTRLLHLPYGDQGIFVRRDFLEEGGGFRDWPLLEDIDLVNRLKLVSYPVVVDAPIQTSGRRWKRLGFWSTCLVNQVVLLRWRLGAHPEELARWYYKVGRGHAS